MAHCKREKMVLIVAKRTDRNQGSKEMPKIWKSKEVKWLTVTEKSKMNRVGLRQMIVHTRQTWAALRACRWLQLKTGTPLVPSSEWHCANHLAYLRPFPNRSTMELNNATLHAGAAVILSVTLDQFAVCMLLLLKLDTIGANLQNIRGANKPAG